ncbi:hypothetical protein [Arenimonas sp.]|uniref:hypothetical protein n=1 Tax=Arenimonas sp. TaxID=1872635 RepID=UPI002E35B0B5|nr:hypothetical protein [Arenimonas sp.]HEX4852752.1 hypothetical protein [Arenimonas sp.]
MIVIYFLGAGAIIFVISALFYFDTVDTEEGLVFFTGAPFLGAAAAFVYGIYAWMKHGEWRSVSTADVLLEAGVSSEVLASSSRWVGIDRLALWLLELNAGWVCLLAGFLMVLSAGYWSSEGATARHVKLLQEKHKRDSAPS